MITVYVYVMDTLADWELGNVTAEIHSKRFFKKNAPDIELKSVGYTKDPITTMGGLTVIPDCIIEDIPISKETVLLLPGSDVWSKQEHRAIIEKAGELLRVNATVCGICGATVALASAGLLDNRPHTSNGQGFLEMFVPTYQGQSYFKNEPAVADNNLITASCTGGLLFAKLILQRLGVFTDETLEAWFQYFTTGEAAYFYQMMQSLQNS